MLRVNEITKNIIAIVNPLAEKMTYWHKVT
jgi:hypothetical protein